MLTELQISWMSMKQMLLRIFLPQHNATLHLIFRDNVYLEISFQKQLQSAMECKHHIKKSVTYINCKLLMRTQGSDTQTIIWFEKRHIAT